MLIALLPRWVAQGSEGEGAAAAAAELGGAAAVRPAGARTGAASERAQHCAFGRDVPATGTLCLLIEGLLRRTFRACHRVVSDSEGCHKLHLLLLKGC